MTPIPFPESNRVMMPNRQRSYSKNVEAVKPLRIYTDGEQCISCWRMSWRERILALIFGRVWIHLLNGAVQPPVSANVKRTVFLPRVRRSIGTISVDQIQKHRKETEG